ncbi:uncharacterized protein LOC114478793 isoform X2 [Gouania willdenowi]|uniref:uncharacterized protein LOC114478793 isoform X2 n=1 Tax=Gouania willdenowi TaxID=441366 RepID=UPI0010556FB2|nr:uncharacterized protein LOC114478793 isoform X2 [Gouania willdenowi]
MDRQSSDIHSFNFHKAPSDSRRNMKATVLHFVISLLGLCETQGAHQVFVRRGGDLLLQVNKLVNHFTSTDFDWKFVKDDVKSNIVKVRDNGVTITTTYKHRAELKENWSVLVKNLKLSDSGTYRGLWNGDDKEHILAEYIVIVQEPVSPVSLTVLSNSSDCIVNTSCSPKDSDTSIIFTCDVKNCTQRSEVKLSGSIVVFVRQDHIICNYSNQVSWEQDKVDISAYCGERSKSHPSGGVHTTAIALGTVICVCVLLAVLIYHLWKRKRMNKEKTASSVPRENNLGQTTHQNSAEEDSTSSPSTTYAMVEFSSRPTESNAYKKASNPETLYAVVSKANNCLAEAEASDEDE